MTDRIRTLRTTLAVLVLIAVPACLHAVTPPDSVRPAVEPLARGASLGAAPALAADSVVVFEVSGREIAVLRPGPDGMAATMRSSLAHQRLDGVRARPGASLFPVEPLRLADRWVVIAGQTPVLEVTPNDAALAELTEAELAAVWADRLEGALLADAGRDVRLRLFWKVALGLLVPVVYVLLLRLVYAGLGRLRRQLRLSTGALETVRAGWLRPFSRGTIGEWVARLVLVVQIALFAVLTYTFLLALFHLFPQTRGLADAMRDATVYVLQRASSALLRLLPRLLALAVLALGLRVGFKLVDWAEVAASRRRTHDRRLRRDQARILNVVAKIGLSMAALLLLAVLMPPSEAQVLMALAVLLVAAGLVTFFYPLLDLGLHVLFEFTGPCEVGDRVHTGGRTGVVTRIEAFGLRILSRQGDSVFLPYREVVRGLEVYPRGTWSWTFRLRIRPPRPGYGAGVAPQGDAAPRHPAETIFPLLRDSIREAWGKQGQDLMLRLLGGDDEVRDYSVFVRVRRRQAIDFAHEAWERFSRAESDESAPAAKGTLQPAGDGPQAGENAAPAERNRNQQEAKAAHDRSGGEGRRRSHKEEEIEDRAAEENREAFFAREVFAEALLRSLRRHGLSARLRVQD